MNGARRAEVEVLAVLLALAAATLYEALVGLGAVGLGSLPGEGPSGGGAVLSIALLVTVLGAALSAVLALRRQPVDWAELLAPAAAAFLVARFYTFDPYYLPTLRRMSEDGLVSPVLVYALVGLSLAAALLTRLQPRAGLLSSAPLILACGLVAWVAEGGH